MGRAPIIQHTAYERPLSAGRKSALQGVNFSTGISEDGSGGAIQISATHHIRIKGLIIPGQPLVPLPAQTHLISELCVIVASSSCSLGSVECGQYTHQRHRQRYRPGVPLVYCPTRSSARIDAHLRKYVSGV